MDTKEFLINLWSNIADKTYYNLKNFYSHKAEIFFPNTGELFLNLDSFIEFNEKYPGNWEIKVEKIFGNLENTVAVVKVFNNETSYYCTAFYTFQNKKISKAMEYWSENLEAPAWRKDSGLTKVMKNYDCWT